MSVWFIPAQSRRLIARFRAESWRTMSDLLGSESSIQSQDSDVEQEHEQDVEARGPAAWRRVIDRNPFYLISGVLMLAGCYAISVQTHGQVDALPPLLWLVAITWVYHAIVLGLAAWLGVGQGAEARRDATHLMVIWLLLSVDAALLYHEVLTRSPGWGYPMTAVAVALAVAGLVVAARRLRIGLTLPAWGMVLLNLLLVYAVSTFYRRWGDAGFLPDLTEFRAAWLLGLWLSLHAIVRRWRKPDAQWRVFTDLLIGLPVIAVIAHVYVGNYTYSGCASETFAVHHLAPLLLGSAAILVGMGNTPETRRTRQVYAIVMGSLAVLIATVADPPPLWWPAMGPMDIYAGVLALTGMAALLLWLWILHREVVALVLGYALALLAFLLHSPPVVRRTGDQIVTTGMKLAPDDGVAWGTLAVIGAFVMLGLGVGMSLWQRKKQ